MDNISKLSNLSNLQLAFKLKNSQHTKKLSIISQSLNNLYYLETLSFSLFDFQLNEQGARMFFKAISQLSQLQNLILNLDLTSITKKSLKTNPFYSLMHLTHITLNMNKFKNLKVPMLLFFTPYQRLNFTYVSLTFAKNTYELLNLMETFQKFPNLISLDLILTFKMHRENQLFFFLSISMFTKLESLSIQFLNKTNIRYENQYMLNMISQLKNLHNLRIHQSYKYVDYDQPTLCFEGINKFKYLIVLSMRLSVKFSPIEFLHSNPRLVCLDIN